MCVVTKKAFLLIFTLLPLFLFSQNEKDISAFKKVIKSKTHKFNTNRYFSKAQRFFIEDEWDSTLLYTMKELSVRKKDRELIDYCHFLRGLSFYEKEVFEEAEKEFAEISNTFELNNNVKVILGAIALEEEEFRKAITYFKEIDTITTQDLLGIKKGNLKHNIGLCYLHLEEYEEAELYLKNSVVLHEQQKDTLELISSYGNMANLYYQQYKDKLAIPYFEKAYQLAKTTNDFVSKQNTAENMAVVEENRKNLSKALQHRKEFEQWKDSVNDQNDIWRTAQEEKKYAINEKEKEVVVLQAENKVKQAERNTFLYSAIVLLLLLVASAYFYREKVKSNKIINAQKEDLDELNATKDKLFSIVSHDLRSSVNAIKTSNKKLVNTLETENLKEVNNLLQNNSAIVNGAYNLLDNLLNWALLQTKQSYFEIAKLHLFHTAEHVAYNYKAILADKELSFENNISKSDVVFADQESLKIILRNLIDNAIKFSNPKGKITLYTQNNNDEFCNLVIEDEGIGMDNSTREELLKETVLLSKKKHENIIGTGLGLQLCKSMIKKNNGKFSIKSELGKGTKMIISLPKKPTQ
ncbi:HAMP domain-containing histidine kinase [Kordia sp. YSTF-M3]|uniref:histidine kinase n=1 Tax=Kordia aestuariivivens TaxID=2759037 RepID=A0ABR7Q8F6_9FLAO|nr:HAMP domain-containing sensor histidine kinase [Kordia aestuariivivens]MBC8754641.1 HAMP domain-containing histidine kinase [Kordia aestuariivivens]